MVVLEIAATMLVPATIGGGLLWLTVRCEAFLDGHPPVPAVEPAGSPAAPPSLEAPPPEGTDEPAAAALGLSPRPAL